MKEWNDKIKDKIAQHEFDFSDQAWEKMDKLLGAPNATNTTQKETVAFFQSRNAWILAAILFIGVFSWFTFSSTEEIPISNEQLIIKNEKVEIKKEPSQPSIEVTESSNTPTIQIQRQSISNSISDELEETVISIDTINPITNHQSQITNHKSQINSYQSPLSQYFDLYNDHHRPDKTYIHTDRTMYKPGESVWFSVYVRDALTLKPSTKSAIVYVEWISPKGTVEKTLQLVAQNGLAQGDILLSRDINGGIYKLKAYTNWQKNSDSEGTQFFEKEITVQKAVIPNLRMKLDFTREAYGASDEVTADLELKNLEDAPLSNHQFEFRVSLDGETHQKGKSITNGIGRAKVKFQLPEHLETNDGLLNVVITYNGQAEAISRSIPIVLNDVDLQFLPESGQILAGMTNKVAFKALNEFGKPADVSGLIFNSDGDTVSTFSSYHQGMGVVSFKAEKDQTYTAKLTQPKNIKTTYTLPKAINNGYAIHVVDQNDSACIIKVKSNDLEQIQLVATAGDNVHFYKNLKNRTKRIEEISIPTVDMPIGITTLTLLNVKKEPLAERLIFVNRHKQLDISVTTNKQKYLPREKAKISITVKDKNGQPIKGQFSLSVADDKQLSFTDDKQANILSQLLLQSELTGKIEKPNFYFDSPKKHPEKDQDLALDYLMLTQGWRKFDWVESINEPLPAQQHKAEDLTITGYVVDINGTPLEGVVVNLSSLKQMTMTDKNGFFSYQHDDYLASSTQAYLQYGSITKAVYLNSSVTDTFRVEVSQFPNKPQTVSDELIFAVNTKKINKRSSIVGKIIDHITNKPFKFANVALYKGKMLVSGTYTDPHGNFDIQSIGAGNYTLQISHTGYAQIIAALIVKHDELVSLDVRLKEGVTLPRLEVVAHVEPLIRQDNTTQGKKIVSQDIVKATPKETKRQERRRQKEEEKKRELEAEKAQREAEINKQRAAEETLRKLVNQQQKALEEASPENPILATKYRNDKTVVVPKNPLNTLDSLKIDDLPKRKTQDQPSIDLNKEGVLRIIDKNLLNEYETLEFNFSPVAERIMVVAPSTKIEVIPAEYETVTERVLAKAESKKLITVPAEYETVLETIEISPATTKWIKRKADKNCLSADPNDCAVWYLVEIPARYETIEKTVLKTPATTKEVSVPAEYQTITKRIVKTPATTRIIEVPAQYEGVNGFAIENDQATNPIAEQISVEHIANRYYRQNLKLATDTIQSIFNFRNTTSFYRDQIVYIIDGKEIPYYKAKLILKEINPEDIATIAIITGVHAVNISTGSSSRGAIYVNTKAGKKAAYDQIVKDYQKAFVALDENYATLEKQYNEMLFQLYGGETLNKNNPYYLQKNINGLSGMMNRLKSSIQIYSHLLETEPTINCDWKDLHSAPFYEYQNALNFKNGRYKARTFYAPKYAAKPSETDEPLVRNDFRTTVYWNGNIQTDENGQATVEFYNSDAITTFRATIEGLGNDGSIGRSEHTYYTQLPFGMMAKAPAVVVTSDIIKLPVTLMNNTNQTLNGQLNIEAPKGFELTATFDKNIELQPYERITIYTSYKVNFNAKDGYFNIRFDANGLNDAFSQFITIKKRGYPTSIMLSSTKHKSEFEFNISNPIEGSIDEVFTVYPTTLNNIVESSKRMLRQPSGCFEQTSSSNYPNLLVLDLLNTTKLNDVKTQVKAMEYLKKGYNRLISFEVEGGGFDWFGQGPAHEGLTAYGLMQFVDMKAVYPVSQRLIDRTADWLLSRRDGHGGWETNGRKSFEDGTLSSDAYIIWALCEAGYGDLIPNEINKSYNDALRLQDAYTMALVANALLLINDSRAEMLLDALAKMQQDDGSFNNSQPTITYGYGISGTISTTALTALAFTKALHQSEGNDHQLKYQLDKAINFLLQSKTPYGFGNTQSTVLAMKALIENAKLYPTQGTDGTVTLHVNGEKVGEHVINSSQMQSIIFNDFESELKAGRNLVKVNISDVKEQLNYDMKINYSSVMPSNSTDCSVKLKTELNAETVKMGETVRLTTTLTNTKNEAVPNPIAIIGLPSGLSIQHWQLKEMQEKGIFDYYELMDGYIVFHFIAMEANQAHQINLDLKADIPGQYEAPASSTYLYYTVEHQQWAAPLKINIKEN